MDHHYTKDMYFLKAASLEEVEVTVQRSEVDVAEDDVVELPVEGEAVEGETVEEGIDDAVEEAEEVTDGEDPDT